MRRSQMLPSTIDRQRGIMAEFTSPGKRGKWFLAVLCLFGILVVASIISTFAEIRLLQQIARGVAVTENQATANDVRQLAIAILSLMVFVATAVAFLMWEYRASKNLALLGANEQRFSPGWAMGWWFVPIFWVFRPYQVIKEIYLSSRPNTLGSVDISP